MQSNVQFTIWYNFVFLSMQLLENHEIFYKKKNLPDLYVGDKSIVTIYLELPKETTESEKKEKERQTERIILSLIENGRRTANRLLKSPAMR